MQGLTLVKMPNFFAKKMDCGSFPIHPTHLISHHPTFFLFGYVKEHLKGMVFPSYEELLNAIGEAMTGIESETLTVVFEHWMEKLE
jgi:hypothetical protein